MQFSGWKSSDAGKSNRLLWAEEIAQGVGICGNLGDMPDASIRALSRSSQKYALNLGPSLLNQRKAGLIFALGH